MGLQNKIRNTLSSMSKEQAKSLDLSLELLEDIENEESHKKIKRKESTKITKHDDPNSSNQKTIENFFNKNNQKMDLVQ